MNKLLLIPLAGLSMLALAACGEGEQKSDSAPEKTEQSSQPAAAPAEPAPSTTTATEQAAKPAPDAGGVLEEAQNALKEQAAALTDEQKQQAIGVARTNAEAAAKAAGQTEDMIKQIGDQAEAAARQVLGVQ